jgi:alkyldihydroxyacetonephosphate synthase
VFPQPEALLRLLGERLGPSEPVPGCDPSRFQIPEARTLPDFGGVDVSLDPVDRLRHARGQGLTDLLRMRSATVAAYPDAVLRPGRDDEIELVLRACGAAGVRVIPWGGGTSVTGGVNVVPDDVPVVSLDLGRMNSLEAIDPRSALATIGAGAAGPSVEEMLAREGFTLGHFPQSWQISTLGGWIATRASGQESLGYGNMADLVAGMDVVAPVGRLSLPSFPASASGPDLRQMLLGSEGRLGVITRATVRVRPRPEEIQVHGFLFPAWEAGLEAARDVVQRGIPIGLLRLSDLPETEVAMTVGMAAHGRAAALLNAWLRLHGFRDERSLLFCGAAGTTAHVRSALAEARSVLKQHRAVRLGQRPGRQWLADRFRHPYLRDVLLDHGYATDTVETAAPWSRLRDLWAKVRSAIASALEPFGEDVLVLCHVSHPYFDGASLYFTFFFRCPTDVEEAVRRWAMLKRAATSAIVENGGALSHHHGVGGWHAPWLEREIGETGHRVLEAAAAAMDPEGVLNPHVLLDPNDRLEV